MAVKPATCSVSRIEQQLFASQSASGGQKRPTQRAQDTAGPTQTPVEGNPSAMQFAQLEADSRSGSGPYAGRPGSRSSLAWGFLGG